MKTHTAALVAILSSSCILATGIVSAQPQIEVKRAIKIGSTSSSTFDAPTQHTIVVGQAGASSISSFQTAMQFEFKIEGAPVNVTNFKVTSASWSLVRNGATLWNKTPFGAYHPLDQGNPDYLPFNMSGQSVMPTGTNQWVADLNGDGSGVIIPTISKFQLVTHPVTLGGVRPLLTTAGHYYTLWYEMSISYTYGESNYTRTLAPSETSVTLLVTNDIPGWQGTGASEVILEISDNLANWQVAPISLPYPLPTVVPNIISLVPKTTNVPGLGSDKRFYRYKQTSIVSLFPPS